MRATIIVIVNLHQYAVKQLEFLVNAPSASVVCGEYCGLQHLHNYEYCGLSRLHNRSNLWSELEKSVAALLQYFIADIITFLSYCMRRTFCLGKLLRSSAQIICSRARTPQVHSRVCYQKPNQTKTSNTGEASAGRLQVLRQVLPQQELPRVSHVEVPQGEEPEADGTWEP